MKARVNNDQKGPSCFSHLCFWPLSQSCPKLCGLTVYVGGLSSASGRCSSHGRSEVRAWGQGTARSTFPAALSQLTCAVRAGPDQPRGHTLLSLGRESSLRPFVFSFLINHVGNSQQRCKHNLCHLTTEFSCALNLAEGDHLMPERLIPACSYLDLRISLHWARGVACLAGLFGSLWLDVHRYRQPNFSRREKSTRAAHLHSTAPLSRGHPSGKQSRPKGSPLGFPRPFKADWSNTPMTSALLFLIGLEAIMWCRVRF